MLIHPRPRILAGILPIVAMLLTLTTSVPLAAAGEADFIVIAHKSVAHDTLSRPELKRIFSKKRSHWDNGQAIVIVEQGGDTQAREAFYHTVLQSTLAQMSSYWINQTMTNGLAPPKIYSNARRVVSYVARTPGAIGFIDAKADVVLTDKIRRVSVK